MMQRPIFHKLLKRKIYLGSRIVIIFCFFFIKSASAVRISQTGGILSAGKDTSKKIDQKSFIPIHFKLLEPGYVTLVIEDLSGVRVCNLVSETWYPAGNNTAWWDGMDDTGRDPDAAKHGVYSVTGKFATAGNYRIRGVFRKDITTHFEFSIYSSGAPSWNTADHTGGWLANHTPPQAALYVPAKLSPNNQPIILLGCYVTEGQDGFAWVDLNGVKKGGKLHIGGGWTAAPFMASDMGPNAAPGIAAYVAAVWVAGKTAGQVELRLNALSADSGDFKATPIVNYPLGSFPRSELGEQLTGLGVYNNVAILSLPKSNQLLLINTKDGTSAGNVTIAKPKGLMIDSLGRLFVLSNHQLVYFKSISAAQKGGQPEVIVNNLEDPYAVAKDSRGLFYISDQGSSHVVKVFNDKGVLIRTIGAPGMPKTGPYNPLHMNNPAGITIDSKQQLWVTEKDYLPKRVSVWSLDGKLLKTFYGPGQYGGGGTLDPLDKSKFYYSIADLGSMEFKLDWQDGTWQLNNVFYRPDSTNLKLPDRTLAPETPLYKDGWQYFTDCYNSSPTSGTDIAVLFIKRNGIAVPAAAMGRADIWDIFKQDQFKPLLPAGINMQVPRYSNAFFIWQDTNADGQVQPTEVTFQKGMAVGITVMPDLSFCIASLDGKALKYSPVSFTDKGTPQYDIKNSQLLAQDVLPAASTGGRQVLTGSNGWSVVTLGIKPYSSLSVSGMQNGKVMWTYPDLWPGLHASHTAPVAAQPGMLIGTTRLLGALINFKDQKTPSLWAINGNHGSIYLFTEDGLFVATVFKDSRIGTLWKMPALARNGSLDSVSLGEENFWPTITKAIDEKVYIVDGTRNSLLRLDGIESIRRLPDGMITLSAADIAKVQQSFIAGEALRQKVAPNIITIPISSNQPVIDGDLKEWKNITWATIDDRGTRGSFNGKAYGSAGAYHVDGAFMVTNNRLNVAYRTWDVNLLQNSGEMPLALFKTGGALDIMIGTSVKADPNRAEPVAGDCRLIVSMVKGKLRAMLYKAVVPGTKSADKIPFSSPSNTITFDSVADVSSEIEFAADKGNYELSIPLAVVGLEPVDGMRIKGDIGLLRGVSGQTVSRTYWSNKATGITSDVPSEAMLTPNLWGTLIFTKAK